MDNGLSILILVRFSDLRNGQMYKLIKKLKIYLDLYIIINIFNINTST